MGLIEFLKGGGKEVGPAMKEVFGERVPNPRLTGPAAKAAVTAVERGSPVSALVNTGLLGNELNNAFNPMVRVPAINKAKDEIGAMLWAQKNPEEAAAAQAGMEGVADRAVQAGVSYDKEMRNKGDALNAKRMYDTMANAPQVQKEVETKRQTVEAGAKEQLRTNSLSRPKAAEAVVQADIQRSGEKVTPQEFKTRVKKETASMKTMDNDQLSKYLSYALVAGGLIASALDKSGNAGKAFAGSFNSQLDRSQQAAMFKYKEDAAAKAAAAEAQRWEAEYGLKKGEAESKAADREVDNQRETTKTMALLDKWEKDAANAQAKLDAYRARTAASGSSGSSPKGVNLSFKDNSALVDSYFSGTGQEVDTGVKEALAARLGTIQKQYPDLSVSEQIETLLPEFTQGQTDPWFGSPEKIYKLK